MPAKTARIYAIMFNIAVSIGSLLLATGLLLLGMGLQGTLLGLRAGVEEYSVTTIGIVMSSYFVGFALGSYFSPRMIRQYGHIRSYAAMASLVSAAAIAYALNTEPLFWILLRIITGFSIMASYVVIESWLNALASNTLRGRFFGAYMIITLLAMAAGQHLLRLGDVSSFELFAISSILVSLALVPVVFTRIEQPQIHEPAHLPLQALYRIAPLGMIATLGAGVITGAFWGMGAIYASSLGLDDNGIAWLMSVIIVGGALLQWPLGIMSDHIDRRKVITLCSLAGATMAALMSLFNDQPALWFYLFSMLFGGFAFTLYGLAVAHTNDHVVPEHSLEAAQGLLQVYGVGAILGPLLASQAIEWLGYVGLPLFYLLVMTLLTGFALLQLQHELPPPSAGHNEFVPMARTSPVALEMSPQTQDDEETESVAQ